VRDNEVEGVPLLNSVVQAIDLEAFCFNLQPALQIVVETLGLVS
jgi:hypothetical protein